MTIEHEGKEYESIDDLFAAWEAEIMWYERCWYFIVRNLSDFKYFIRGLYDKLTIGFDRSDAWCIYYCTAEFVLPRLKMMRGNLHGSPIGVGDKNWEKKIDNMIYSFEQILEENETGKPFKDLKRVEAGLRLFGKYYLNLWD